LRLRERRVAQWTGCIAGALTTAEFAHVLADAGLVDIDAYSMLPCALVKCDRWYLRDDLYDGPMRFPDSGVVLTPLVASEASPDLASEAS
jgi:hypothetical protein